MIRAWIVGDDAVIARLDAIPGSVAAAVRRAVEGQAIALTRYVKESKLSGQVLRNRSGLLRASISYALMIADQGLTAQVGANVEYAHVHEYGGDFAIKAHQRMMTQAFGRPVAIPRMISVRAHDAHYPERSFLRSSLEENAASIRAAIEAAVAEGIKA